MLRMELTDWKTTGLPDRRYASSGRTSGCLLARLSCTTLHPHQKRGANELSLHWLVA